MRAPPDKRPDMLERYTDFALIYKNSWTAQWLQCRGRWDQSTCVIDNGSDRYFGERIRAGRTAEHAKLVASEPILAIKHINHIAE
ncbi:hypothetical protein GWE18_28525 [Bradyrhizobium sp. CSA112]|nr:hypothetical protein [Bradyrhizobium sp. CSA112]